MTGFGARSIALICAAGWTADRSAVASAQLALLEASQRDWVPSERDAEMVRLRASSAPRSAAPVVTAAPVASTAKRRARGRTAELRGDARARFLRAQELLPGNAVAAAYQAAKPLFTEYPRATRYRVSGASSQTLRWLPRQQLLAEWRTLRRLAPDGGADARWT